LVWLGWRVSGERAGRMHVGEPEQFLQAACGALGCFGRGVCPSVVAGLGVVDGLEDVALHVGGGGLDLLQGWRPGAGVHLRDSTSGR
jgi:hypothetical protein